jgi:hypothetical protein
LGIQIKRLKENRWKNSPPIIKTVNMAYSNSVLKKYAFINIDININDALKEINNYFFYLRSA